MKTLVIFRRPEIWILMLVVAALGAFAFRSEEEPEIVEKKTTPEPIKVLPEKKPDAKEEAPEEKETKTDLAVKKVEVDKSEQGWVVDLTLLGRSTSEAEAPVTEETLTARTGQGDPVNHFFEPFKEEQSLLPDEDSLVTVRLWLEKPAESISLDFQGRTVNTELPR